MTELTDSQLDHLDGLVFRGQIIPSFVFLRETLNISLPECQAYLRDRFDALRKATPEKFRVNIENYWNNFYS